VCEAALAEGTSVKGIGAVIHLFGREHSDSPLIENRARRWTIWDAIKRRRFEVARYGAGAASSIAEHSLLKGASCLRSRGIVATLNQYNL
jgi:hypothetical protein